MSRRSRNRHALTCCRGMCTVIRRAQRLRCVRNTHTPLIACRAGCRGGRVRRESWRCGSEPQANRIGQDTKAPGRGVRRRICSCPHWTSPDRGGFRTSPRLCSIWNCGHCPPRYLEFLPATCARIWNCVGLGPGPRPSFSITAPSIGFFPHCLPIPSFRPADACSTTRCRGSLRPWFS